MKFSLQMAFDKKAVYISDCQSIPGRKAGFTYGASIVAGILKLFQQPIPWHCLFISSLEKVQLLFPFNL